MKMAGGSQVEEMDLGEFIRQADEYEQQGSFSDQAYKVLNLLGQSHPFPVLRVNELLKWIRNGEYDSILRGFYAKEEREFSEDLKEASQSYTEGLKDNFGNTFKEVGDNVQTASKKAKEIFETFFSQNKQS